MVAGAGLHYECKVVFQQPMNPEPLDSALKPGGYVIRGKALWYLSEILRQRR